MSFLDEQSDPVPPSHPPDLQTIIDRLLADSADTGQVMLDAIGEILGTRPTSADEVGAILEALEAAGRTIVEPPHDGPRDLARVLIAVRVLRVRLGRNPILAEIAVEAGLPLGTVRAALLLGRVMGHEPGEAG